MARGFGPALLPLFALALTACGGGAAQPEGEQAAGPAPARPSASRSASGPARSAAPTLPPGPGGRTAVFSHGPRGGDKVVALTFDAEMTSDQGARAAGGERFDNPALVASLRRLKVPATFFMTGRWAQEYADQARSIGRDPLFEVAGHTTGDPASADSCHTVPPVTPSGLRADVERAFTAIRRAGVPDPLPYVRFRDGCFSDRALREVAPAGVTAVRWDVAAGDALATDTRRVAEQVLSQVKPGSVVALRSTLSTAPVTDEAVERIVPQLRARGYRFVRVSELIRAGG
ncbi:polysaccharide deacetylase family protein [Streptomyces sp. 8N706]|uniref:polysaccharide deacetylase family protein n=1 Tax=Streptomyces sp. 8N706 TaxID=3457416 RepID=UPI003FCFE653